jgi:hypothetical protein
MLIYKNIFELNSMQLNVHVNVYDRVRLETFDNVQFKELIVNVRDIIRIFQNNFMQNQIKYSEI